MKVIVSPRAKKELKKIPKFDQIAITQKIIALPDSTMGEEKLSGHPHIYRVRVGHYRIVYKKTKEFIYIYLIDHRRDIYRALGDLLR